MTSTKVLITGATGYIGGSVLSTLRSSANSLIKEMSISALVRQLEHVDALKGTGVNAVLFGGLDETDLLRRVASDHDIVINAARASHHPKAAEALILGLQDRQKTTGKITHFIHTSGTSSLGDRPITGTFTETRVFSDEDDIHAYLRDREDREKYHQRTTDLVVVEKGEAAGVKTYILMSPTVYAPGSGIANRTSVQIDAIMRVAKKLGVTPVVGPGEAEWDHVHIEDLADLYELLLARLLRGDQLPCNKKGIYFNETGHHPWREVSERVAKTGKALGFLKTDQVGQLSLEEAAAEFGAGLSPEVAELAFASRSRTQADLARKIGWTPKKTRKDFEESFAEEWKVIASEGG